MDNQQKVEKASAATSLPRKPRNPALKMLGLPALPKRLPSRNWMIFWAVTGAFTTAIIYDKREKNRATAKWRRAVEPLSRELLGSANALPRKLTVYLEAPPGDGLRVAQDHFIEYVKPVLSASGLDWEFVQGRQQGDVRAAVAERIRRSRMAHERPGEEIPKTDDSIVEDLRRKMGLKEYDGVKGDIVIGRHAWKEYVRGLHEGWLGPLDPPPLPEPEPEPEPVSETKSDSETPSADDKAAEAKAEEQKKQDKPSRPPQPRPHNTTGDYESASLPVHVPAEFPPSAVIAFPHRLGFTQTFVRLGRFLNRRKLADDIGRQVAAVCFAAARDYREHDGQYEQQLLLVQEERDWPKHTWKEEEPAAEEEHEKQAASRPKKERIWASPMVVDARIAQRMRRFEIQPRDEESAAKIAVPEEEVEGWIKGSFRRLWRWGVGSFDDKPRGPNVGNLDDD
ncbi:mitochondrial import inner membrane translocase subunit tim-54 [Metarhizium album ARSEF 1941]|uniref:Mitochondrial import inner membrane translocase subunit TIM54 n=1 Tax=Metarhizium album (strain ARSEF 1941) TaxID=1081103 RepID=A0A0B2WF05_METAS|nr:mitochondrial import inner membrane translocase subunit tim-54 [Metarhizium album ARSEF 1941]KHN94471.1 mitochondrial import inner membrane translocase subunit tim-54 [Metarhizium album ARSEF 1941]